MTRRVFGSMVHAKARYGRSGPASLLTLLGCAIIGIVTEFVRGEGGAEKASTSISTVLSSWRWR